MNIFKQFGIKEVVDVTLYSIHRKTDGSGDIYYIPALYLDTLKISTVEKTAEGTWAEGGKGNGQLVYWDYGKRIKVSLEDALCTPASLSLCWSGILSSNWKNNQVDVESSISVNRESFLAIDRMEKCIYPNLNLMKKPIDSLLPSTENLNKIKIEGYGLVRDKIYNWKIIINTATKSVFTVPDRFFDTLGKNYYIDQNKPITVNTLPTYSNLKDAVIYKINNPFKADNNVSVKENSRLSTIITDNMNQALSSDKPKDRFGSIYEIMEEEDICAATYLGILVDNNDEYYGLIGIKENDKIFWKKPKQDILMSQFKGLDMWIRFQSINTLIYFLITKYKENISEISDENLWCYLNPETMTPYEDDYWFDQGDIYYINSITLTPKDRKIKGNKITVLGDQWPGMYMMIGETFTKERGTNKEEHMQIKFPLCKVKSDHTLTLQADGEPVILNFDLEVARPENGVMMELTSYEAAPKLLKDENGRFYEVDGSTKVLSD